VCETTLKLPHWWSSAGVSEFLTPVGHVVPVLGAGVSCEAGLPGAGQLAEWLADNAPLIATPLDRAALSHVVDTVDISRMPPEQLRQLVATYIESFPLRSTSFLDELVRLPSRFIVTLNYDDLVGDVAEQQGLQVRRLSARRRDELSEAHRLLAVKDAWPPPELTVFHLHGRAREPETLVLDGGSYQELSSDSLFGQIVFMLTHDHRLAFVGTKLDEFYLLAELQKQIHAASHVVFCRMDEAKELIAGRAALSHRQHLRVVGYPHHSELIVLPRWLNVSQTPRGRATKADVLDLTFVPNPEDYVISEFVERSEMAVSEGEIRDGQRTIVVGGAGTGKTHLLSWLVAKAREERPAVLIRLAYVKIVPGKPANILIAWARQGRSSPGRPGVDVSASALREDRLHFLLDGLDEVSNELQEEAASLINQVAERYPQHAFTVTSRPVPALAALGYGTPPESTFWRFVDLKPGTAWQRRYLDSCGVTLSQLEAAMPALSDMRELLHNPFFLTRTIELFQNGQLKGLRDVGELLERLLDFALSREEGLLPMVGLDDTRSWLRRVALAATLAGQRTFTLDDLRKVPVSGDLAGDLGKLIEQLQLRLLLIEENGQLRFSHRLVADELAAEALAEIDPSDVLLDALVPIVDEQLVGVRDDVTIAIALLCLRSVKWRLAVAGRDPLAAARATPSDAPVKERAAAVSLIWGTYEEWKIWAWDRSAPDLVEDTEVLARLLRPEHGGSQAAELRRLLHDGDEIQQGNALRVLSRVVPAAEMANDLRRVLRDPARNGVVIREAAMAAADLDLTDLIDDIVFVMLESRDPAVHQVGAIALRELTPHARLLDVAKRLVACRESVFFISSVRERMSATDRIDLARALAMSGAEVFTEERADLGVAAKEVTPSANVVQAAACAAAFWHDESDEIKALFSHDPRAAAHGVLEAMSHGAEWWNLASLASHVDLDILRDAAVDERIIESAECTLRLRAMSAQERADMRREIEQNIARQRRTLQRERPLRLALADLLQGSGDETDRQLQACASELRDQVHALSDEDLKELRRRIASWWPVGPFGKLVKANGTQISLDRAAHAWLILGPAATMPVTDEQWAQLATQPFIYSEQSDWLRLQATQAGMRRAMALVTDNRVRAWQRLLDCCTAPPPEFVVEACTASVETDADSSEDTTYLMQRLVAGGPTDGALAWAARDPIAARALRPLLALEGDIEAQRLLVHELREDTRVSRPWSRDELGWMSALREPEFLEPLFAILETTYSPSAVMPKSSGWTLHDVLTPTLEAIVKIGGRDAVRRYDVLLARGDDLRWFRTQRNRIAAEVLLAKGNVALPAAVDAARVPLFLSVSSSGREVELLLRD
jgi:SIR2-like domain/NACHT domain